MARTTIPAAAQHAARSAADTATTRIPRPVDPAADHSPGAAALAALSADPAGAAGTVAAIANALDKLVSRPHQAAWRLGVLIRRCRVPRGHALRAPSRCPAQGRPVPGAVPLFERGGHRAVSTRGSGRGSSPSPPGAGGLDLAGRHAG